MGLNLKRRFEIAGVGGTFFEYGPFFIFMCSGTMAQKTYAKIEDVIKHYGFTFVMHEGLHANHSKLHVFLFGDANKINEFDSAHR